MKGKLFYEGEEVVAINKITKPVDEDASRASNLVYNKTYSIEMYWRFSEGHWWVSVEEIADAVYTEDEFASLCSIKELGLEYSSPSRIYQTCL